MKSNTESKDLNLTTVIDSIYNGDYQLPEFQRDYVWKDTNIKSLFESVLSAHPIGTILILELDKEQPLLAWTNFSEILPAENRQMVYNKEDKNPPDYLILDGQQRLTSLAHITHGTSKATWYLDLIPVKDSWENDNKPDEKNSISTWIEQKLEISEYVRKGKKADDPMRFFRGKQKKMPLTILRDKNTFLRALNEVRDSINATISEKNYEKKNHKKLNLTTTIKEIEQEIKEQSEWSEFLGIALPALIDNYFDYKLPTVVVSKSMGITGVCKVFTKINTTGIELGAFDLTVAVMYPKNVRLKQMFDDAMDSFPLVKTIDESAKRYILHTVALLSNNSPKTASLPEVLKPKDIHEFWDKAVINLDEACTNVDEYCGASIAAGNVNYLVYSPLMSILAYVINTHPIKIIKNPVLTLLRSQKLKAWYFGCGVSNRYSEGTDAKQQKDKKEISLWMASPLFEENMPSWLENIYCDFNSSKSSAVGKSVISMYNLLKPKDFYEDKTVGPGEEIDCDLHHIFPRAAMRKKIMKDLGIRDNAAADKLLKTDYNIDSVMNLTWMSSITNRNIIRDRMPSEYLNEIIRNYGGGENGKNKLLSIMYSHCINKIGLDHLLQDNYQGFIEERKKSMISEMKTTGFVRNILTGNDAESEISDEISEFN
ncbi:DUF262 domain-containing protein [uncultured Mucilaginibacter sp.]|uniref:DUF262 domain-containing protein n=1 Tax=uncultured Mucilaginibacter sp. TaxID=797541 RepID=UPI0025F6EAE2|nr:DUF262 domain-containing protein [uncultured Mucilaginibacter sp.]